MKLPRLTRRLILVGSMSFLAWSASAQDLPTPTADAPGAGFRDIVRRQNPTVVSITARTHVQTWRPVEEQVFRLFGVQPPAASERIEEVAAAGVIISATGEILTNHHVVENADSIDVVLFGDERTHYQATVVGGDAVLDIALIRLERPPPHLPIAVLGDSTALLPGDWVLAIGNPYQLGHSVTAGVVSAAPRGVAIGDDAWRDLIQTDASITFGSSGGPLIDTHGAVVGITVAMFDNGIEAKPNIGFAVPVDSIKAILHQLRAGHVTRGRIDGLFLHPDPIRSDEAVELGLSRPGGAIIKSVARGSAAERAGLRAGDVIVTVQGQLVAQPRDVLIRTSSAHPGTLIPLDIVRGGSTLRTKARIEAVPLEPVAPKPAAESAPTDGFTFDDLTPALAAAIEFPGDAQGARVLEVVPDSAADAAGLAAGDIVLRVNRARIRGAADLSEALSRIDRRRPVLLLVWREDTEVFLSIRRD